MKFGFDDSTRKAGLLWTAAAGAVALVVGYYVVSSKKKRSKQKLRREVSFTSLGLALGTFPEQANVPKATVNTAMYFRKGECPTVNTVAEQMVEPLLVYERFSQSLDMQTHQFRPPSQSYTALDLVRELVINGDENLTTQTVFAHLQDVLEDGRKDLPWWEILIIRNEGAGSSACVLRVHHTVADGLSLVTAFQKIIVAEDGAPVKLLTDTPKQKPNADPRTKKSIWAVSWSVLAATFHVITLGATKFDDDTAFSKHNHAGLVHTGKREFIMFPEIPLAFVKAIKAAAKCTVNDVLMAAVSQAIYEYCQQQDDPVLKEKGVKLQCRALLPVGFPRPPEEFADPALALSNKWSMASCDIALGQTNVVDRLRQIHVNTTEMKEKPRAYMQLKIQNSLVKHLPRSIARQTCFDVFSRHSLVLTNVPGPAHKCRLAGKTVEKVHLFFNNILSQVNLISYSGMVYGNIIYDADALPELAPGFGLSYALALVDLAKAFEVEVPKEILALRRK